MHKNSFTIEEKRQALAASIRTVSKANFANLALEVFQYQAAYNAIYAQFIELLHIKPTKVGRLADIPYLPISLFKTFSLQTGNWDPVKIFTSSGTSGKQTSRHLLRSENWYQQHARTSFEQQYGPLKNFTVLALLPAYLERQGSSLVYMADDFIRHSDPRHSGFYLDDLKGLANLLAALTTKGEPVLLLGVSFALLDLIPHLNIPLGDQCIVMETGGMKGRRREMTRTELHTHLQEGLGVKHIHSEYGMTELLSQAYAPVAGRFIPAATLAAFTREVSDPLRLRNDARTGALNLIDLANLDTISFIATDDLGRVYPDGTFEVLGRMDASDTRGCNLLVA